MLRSRGDILSAKQNISKNKKNNLIKSLRLKRKTKRKYKDKYPNLMNLRRFKLIYEPFVI